MELYGVTGFSASSLSLHIQAVLQGSFVLAKAHGRPAIARKNVAHLKLYFELLFQRGDRRRKEEK